MGRKPLVSIIIPVYNAEKYLPECLESILRQSYPNIEIIIIDDGSTDESGRICEEYARRSPALEVIHKRNGGVGSARNIGINKARGEYIGFIDSDDWVDRQYVADLVQGFLFYDADISICGYKVALDETKRIIAKYSPSFFNICGTEEFALHLSEMVDKKFFLSPWMKLYRMDIIDKYCVRFDERRSIGEDLLFNFAYFKHIEKVTARAGRRYYYRIHEGESLIHTFGNDRIANTQFLFGESVRFCKEMKIDKKCMYIFSKYYFKSHMNFVESKIMQKEDTERLKKMVKKIINQKAMAAALKYKKRGDAELMIYNFVFGIHSVKAVLLLAKARIFVKKRFRGY